MNEVICGVKLKKDSDDSGPDEPPDPSGKNNRGTLIVDATCAPADIRYPTDCSLLNEAREKLEAMIDDLFEPFWSETDCFWIYGCLNFQKLIYSGIPK